MRIYIVRQYWICNGKEAKLFFNFSKMANTPHKGKNKTHCVVIKLSIQGTMLSSRWKWHCTWWQILHKRKKERFVVLATFWKNDNSSCFDISIVSTESQVLYSFIIKVRMDTPIFLFSYLLLIALYTYSTYIIWLKKYSVVFYFLNFWHVITFCSSCHHLQ